MLAVRRNEIRHHPCQRKTLPHPSLIKDFEREARTDGLPARELADRKRLLVNELNSYIALKKVRVLSSVHGTCA